MEEKKNKIVKIAFDLDGVIIDKPPLIPRWLLEWLTRVNKNKELAYRFPKYRLEQFVRWLSHNQILRPPIKKNLELIEKFAKNKKTELYIVSSRYSFLKSRTYKWLKKYKILSFFKGIFINLKNEQPHIFKEKMIKKLNIDYFIDDDLPLIKYLYKKTQNVVIINFPADKDKLEEITNKLIHEKD